MQKRAPTIGNILVIILFVLSCFGLLMFLWESFGGPLPLKPKGYRFTVAFPRALALAEQSDVRISGVDVGHVVAIKLGNDGRTHATIELAGRYAPIRADTHAILRQKTLLGETYVQLLPEAQSGPFLGDGKQLADSQVEPSVTLDDILAAFDPKTRRDFQIWQQAAREGIENRGEQINAGFAELEPFAQKGNQLLTVLNSQEGALREIIHNTGVVFNALASRDHQLEGLIVNGEHTFKAAAAGSQAFAQAFQALPAFEHNSRVALKELDRFAADATPFLEEFQPAERRLSSLLTAAKPFTPEFNGFLTSIGPLTAAAKVGLPDIKKTLNLTTPVLENTRPVLHNLDPFLQYTGEYVPDVQAFFANLTAATAFQGTNGSLSATEGPKEHLLTTMSVINPESLALYPSRIGTDRSNPYQHAGALQQLASGPLSVYSSSACANSAPAVNPEGPESESISKSVIEQILGFKVANKPESPNEVAAPPCQQQSPSTFNGQTSQFPHVVYNGK
ncbi:MAG TPA: MlaD family protein [Solirubrobacteraceae bacterium]|jgi:virulence factor Mce-like protein|nr:MlaD family protein [Solirubrobacteraceae bacterium]